VSNASTSSARAVALVTGGGSGLGREIALALAAADFDVTITGRTEQTLAATAREADGITARVMDVRDGDAVRDTFAAFERLDLLVNNAGISMRAVPVEEVPENEWRDIVDTNLTGMFLCAQAAYALMKRQRPQGGRIINNGSVSSQVPRPFAVGYTATKHAVSGLTKALALEGRAHRIACGQIDIGNAATDMTERMAAGVPQADGRVAAEPTFDARLVAEAVVHLARLPLDVNVPFMTLMANGMPLLGRG
jgi:NAD(P)-dependent dehydrogenase (short-subunit alcohol dehydrogenase family)